MSQKQKLFATTVRREDMPTPMVAKRPTIHRCLENRYVLSPTGEKLTADQFYSQVREAEKKYNERNS